MVEVSVQARAAKDMIARESDWIGDLVIFLQAD
jgi:hypothetical protein